MFLSHNSIQSPQETVVFVHDKICRIKRYYLIYVHYLRVLKTAVETVTGKKELYSQQNQKICDYDRNVCNVCESLSITRQLKQIVSVYFKLN